jgi:hypothetical protein
MLWPKQQETHAAIILLEICLFQPRRLSFVNEISGSQRKP